jgi:ferredoxin
MTPETAVLSPPTKPPTLDATTLRALCFDAGADDVGFVEVDRPALTDDREDVLAVLPGARTLISIVRRMNRENVRSPLRSVANFEFHNAGDEVNAIEREIVRKLEAIGIRAACPAMGFPMEIQRYGEKKTWIVSHKRVAVEAGLGHMGIHRNVIHPRFGNFILLGTVFVAAEIASPGAPLPSNPCVTCKLCVAACPVGAIHDDGGFDWAACSTHNYREFFGGFLDWVDTTTGAESVADYRRKMSDAETVSMWQSLAYGPNYKAAYCLSVCPAGTDVIGPFLADRREHLERVVRPLQRREELVYVVKGSDAEAHVAKRFPHKTARIVRSGLRPQSARGFLRALPSLISRRAAGDWRAVLQFRFEGAETLDATVTIEGGRVLVDDGLAGKADVHVTADSKTWIGVLREEVSLLSAVLRGRIRVRGNLGTLRRFRKCFPS